MSDPTIRPYLFFGGRCDEALKFYQHAVGAEVLFQMRYNESPVPQPTETLPPDFGDKIMHASVRIGNTEIYASDGQAIDEPHSGYMLAYAAGSVAEADEVFEKLSNGGQVRLALTKTFWSPRYGILTDQFGVTWMVMARTEN